METSAPRSELFHGVKKSGPNYELGLLLDQVREAYKEQKIEERTARAKKRRKLLIAGSVILLGITILVVLSLFAGLLKA